MRSLVLAILLPAASWSQVLSFPKANVVPQIMIEWAESQKTLPDMVVRFKQTRTVPALKQPVISHGRFWRFQDGAFRWELGDESKASTILVHDAKEFRVRESPEAAWQLLEENDSRFRMWARFLSGRDASPDDLARHFIVKEIDAGNEVAAITLKPKAPFVKRYLKQLELQLDRASKRLLQIRILQGDGADVLMQFDKPGAVSSAEKAMALAR
jgi:hypothetical protein